MPRSTPAFYLLFNNQSSIISTGILYSKQEIISIVYVIVYIEAEIDSSYNQDITIDTDKYIIIYRFKQYYPT